jgi:serine/threonine protein kinase
VVRTFDCGLRPDGHVYMLMDYLEGTTLNAWHSFDDPLHPAQAVTIVHQACLGLAEPHAQGIVHRDVKPENIFVQDNGQIKVLDFGLARSWDGSPVIGANATQMHMVVGTPHYSQPEQLKTRVLTPASDVYSLATILYELLSAHSPFHPDRPLNAVREEYREKPVRWLHAHANMPVVPLDSMPGCEHLPTALVDGITLALDKEPRAARPTPAPSPTSSARSCTATSASRSPRPSSCAGPRAASRSGCSSPAATGSAAASAARSCCPTTTRRRSAASTPCSSGAGSPTARTCGRSSATAR